MMIIFNKKDLIVRGVTDSNQVLEKYCSYFTEDEKRNLDSIYLDAENVPDNYLDYKVIEGRLVEMEGLEVQEIKNYGYILTEEERQLNKLKPSLEEIQKAENTIETLTLIQEVIN